MKLETPLVGQYVALRGLESADATPEYLSWLNDLDVTRHLEVRLSPPRSIHDLVRFCIASNASEDTILAGIVLRETGRHIGNIKLGPINKYHRTSEIGLLIGERSEWGKGYARAAIELMSNYAFERLGLAKLTAGCYAGNQGSRYAFLNAGYVEEGRRVAQWQVDGGRVDGILLGKLNPASINGAFTGAR